MKNKIFPVIFAGLLLALILVSACTETSQPPLSPVPGRTTGVPAVPVTPGTSGIPGASVTTKIPATTNTPGTASFPSGQTRCDGSCIDTQSNLQHCGTCGNVCNTSEPCSEGKCLSWAGSWAEVSTGWKFELTQTGTSVNGTDSYKQEIFYGSTSGNPPRLTGTWVTHGTMITPFTFDMAPDGKSFTGGKLEYQILTYTREQD